MANAQKQSEASLRKRMRKASTSNHGRNQGRAAGCIPGRKHRLNDQKLRFCPLPSIAPADKLPLLNKISVCIINEKPR